jgi:hypothetical protein
MRIINTVRPSGFTTRDNIITILDSRGKLFYCKEKVGETFWFNLPVGSYKTNNTLMSAPFREYNLPSLPDKDRNIEGDVKTISDSRMKGIAKTIPTLGHIYLNPSLKYYSECEIAFAFWHEYAHKFYKGGGELSEKNCDLYATWRMLQDGYNPTQIWQAQKNLLTGNGIRKQFVCDYLSKTF